MRHEVGMGYEKLGSFKYKGHAVLILVNTAPLISARDLNRAPFRYQISGPEFNTYQDAFTLQQINRWIRATIDQAIRRKKQGAA